MEWRPDILHSRETLKAFHSKSGARKKNAYLHSLFSTSTICREKEIKGKILEKEKIKFLFSNDDTLSGRHRT